MKNKLVVLALLSVVPLLTSCDAILGLLQPNQVTVRLANNGSFDIEVTVVTSDNQNVTEDILDSTGATTQYTIAAGQVQTFTRNCSSLQAIRIKDAQLLVIGQVGPHTNSAVFRDGTDFNCGSTLTFTFQHGDLLVDFNVTFASSQ
jgi:hypothetical protein